MDTNIYDLDQALSRLSNNKIIVLDLETNGLNEIDSVLTCAAIKYEYSPSQHELTAADRFLRYYFSKEPENPEAIRINGLTREIISEKRSNNNWPQYFADDEDFRDFCADTDLFVAHNISFDSKFVPFIKNKKMFCTMKSNTQYFFGKYPKLVELAAFLNLNYYRSSFHDSAYDVEITGQILQKMIHLLTK